MNILIISGGTSSERKISLMSASEVKKALEVSGFKVKIFDLKKGYAALKELSKDFDVIFPVIHGEEGEGGALHKFLKGLKKPFVGGDWRAFKKGWYKISCKRFFESSGVPTAEWKELKIRHSGRGLRPCQNDMTKKIIEFGFPCVLKTDNGGSSREVVILKSEADLQKNATKKLLDSGCHPGDFDGELSRTGGNVKLFVERFVPGAEITVGILDDQALPVIEIVPPEGGWFDYKNKYWGKTKELAFAPSLDQNTQKEAQVVALKIHQNLNLGHYSRIDFIVAKGKPYALEVNTIPGMTAGSLLPKAALAAGLDFPQLVKKLVELAFSKPIV